MTCDDVFDYLAQQAREDPVQDRRKPVNCQNEPDFGVGLLTVICSLRYPELTCHMPLLGLCELQSPHEIRECGLFKNPVHESTF